MGVNYLKCSLTTNAVFFLPRDAMHKHGPYCRPVSVCLSSRWCIVSMTAEISSNFSSRPGYPKILVFLTPSADTQFSQVIQWGAKYTGGKILRF